MYVIKTFKPKYVRHHNSQRQAMIGHRILYGSFNSDLTYVSENEHDAQHTD